MHRTLLPLLAAVAALVGAAPAGAAWTVRPADVEGRANAAGAAALPDGSVASVLVRTGADRALELRIGDRTTTLDRSAHSFGDVGVEVDRDGDVSVAYTTIPPTRDARGVYVWHDDRVEEIPSSRYSATWVRLDVASDGGAIVGWAARDGIFVARRAPGEARFRTPVRIADPHPSRATPPVVAALPGGGAAVAVTDTLWRALDAGPLETARRIPLPAFTREVWDQHLLATGDDVTYVYRATMREARRAPQTRVVQAAVWERSAAAPTAPATLSRGDLSGSPDAAVVGDHVHVAFKDAARTDPGRADADLAVVLVGPDGAAQARARWQRTGSATARVALAPDGDAVRVYTRAHGALRTMRFAAADAVLVPGRAEVVAPGFPPNARIHAVGTPARPTVVWDTAASFGRPDHVLVARRR